LYTRFSRPRGTFISSAFQSGVIVKESLVFKGVGMAIVDTNVKTQAIKIPIPGMMII
jgi:ribosomal protein S2